MLFFTNLLGIITGIAIPYLLNSYGMLIGYEGVQYYAEVHTTFLNSIIHTMFMPFTTYGILLWAPRVITYDYNLGIKIQHFLYSAYMTHYLLINPFIGALTSILYYYPLFYAKLDYKNKVMYPFTSGLFISTIALAIQEVFGHWLSGDPPSRIEAVPNAILYAMYYSVSHLFT